MTEEHATLIRLSLFVLILCTLLIAEWRWPFRRYQTSKLKRLADNLGLMFFSSLVQKFVSAGGAFAVAVWSVQNSVGIFNLIALPQWLEAGLSLLLLDFAIYTQHIIFHRVSWLWKIHRVHHSDIDFDCSTAVRFHFIEIVLSTGYKMILVALIGAPAFAVIIFEISLNGFAMFNHSNIHFRPAVDNWLRYFVITPDMHRIHHSTQWRETNSNYGFSIPWWDKLCGTYTANPEQGQSDMQIGLPDQPDFKPPGFIGLLLLPFQSRQK
jgi:sterol desaturase/sphingolipid hydroxylase (fatty acid hydroxylase superfamily)